MAGIQNRVLYGEGEKITPTSARSISDMQQDATDIGNINFTGDPNGSVAANPSSICRDPVSGNLYLKQTGTGNTGWIQIPSPLGVTATLVLTDEAITRGDGGARGIQTSLMTISDTGVCNGCTQMNVDNIQIDGDSIINTSTNGPINLTPNGSGPVSQTRALVGGQQSFVNWNTDNTNSGSEALYLAEVGGASAGDPYIAFGITGVRSTSIGIDNSDSDTLKITTLNALIVNPSSGTTLLSMTTGGVQNLPLQPAFAALLGTTATDVTGDNTNVDMGAQTVALTEIFDAGSNFTVGNGAGTAATFTAPTTGHYYFTFAVFAQNLDVAMSTNMLFLSSNRNWFGGNTGTFANNTATLAMSALIDMDAADTVTFRFNASGSTKTADLFGGATDPRTFITGFLQG